MRRDLWIGFLLAALVLSVYWPVGNHTYIAYDDPQFITENPQIQARLSWQTVVYAFTHPVAGNWHPITTLSHALDCEMLGIKAGAHHLVNAVVHALNAALLFLVLQSWPRNGKARSGDRAYKGGGRTENWTGKDPNEGSGLGLRQITTRSEATWRNFLIAASFALHPLRVESVAWVAERKDVLTGFFFLATLYFYGRFVQALRIEPRMCADGRGLEEETVSRTGPGRKSKHESGKAPVTVSTKPVAGSNSCSSVFIRGKFFASPSGDRYAWLFYLAALLSFALGLMSKPMLVTLPFVLLLLDFWPSRRFELADFKSQISILKRLFYEKAPFFLFALAASWVTLQVQETAGAMEIAQGISLEERFSNAVTSYVRYLGKLLWPSDLAVIYPHPARHYFLTDTWPGWEIVLAVLLLVCISVLCLLELRRRPYLAVGWFWFLGTLVPVIGLVQVGEQAMADRYTYIPLIGPVVALFWWANEMSAECGVRSAEWGRRIGAVALIAVLAGLTRHQLGYWQNTVTLFEHTVAVTADNPSAQFALGVGLEEQGQAGKAMVRYRVAVAIDPHYSKAHYNMGQLLRKAGYWQNAADAYLQAARYNPGDVPTQLNLASTLTHLGRTGEGIAHYNRALELDPKCTEGLNNLAWVLSTSSEAELRDGVRAIQLGERACALTDYRQPVFLGTLSAAYAEAGRFNEAIITSKNAIALASEAGDAATAEADRKLLELYQANKPYREPTAESH